MKTKEQTRRLQNLKRDWPPDLPNVLLISHPPDLNYLLGFTGSLGTAVITPDQSILLVDSRYLEQAKKETIGCSVRLAKDPFNLDLKNLLEEVVPDRWLAVESRQLSFDSALRIQSWGYRLHPLYDLIKKQRAVKSEFEIRKLKNASAQSFQAMNSFLSQIPWQRTETYAAGLLELECRLVGSQGPSFETIVASGPKTALPHARPGSEIIRRDRNLLIDFGIRLEHYCSDSTRMVVPSQQSAIHDIVSIVTEAQNEAIRSIKPGVLARDVDSAARKVIEKYGYGENFGHGTGHGLGLEVHEYPNLSPRSDEILQAGMVCTIEPGIYIPGRFGVRIEDTAVVTTTGCEVFG